jgi:hypothetical protein
MQLIAETPRLGTDILAHFYEDHHFRERIWIWIGASHAGT